MKKIQLAFACILAIALFINAKGQNVSSIDYQGIKIYDQNPWYWQYRGEPVILRGGTDTDALFQWTGKKLTDHLDLLVSVGGNYVRNTMSDRNEGNVFAFKKVNDNKYDLNQWNEEYWNRLAFFLDETSKRDVIVQLTLWDQFDVGGGSWDKHPWNPDLNVNMKPGSVTGKPDFYATVEAGNKELLAFQKKYSDKLFSVTLRYDNVLYNINNESSESIEWENFWARYIKEAAEKAGKRIYVTNMQFSAMNTVRHVMTYGNLFDFVDISQSNQDSQGARGPAHWDYLMFLRTKIASFRPMPMNNEKIYGANDGSTNASAGTETEAINRFWRNIFAGCAAVRFHRPAGPDRFWGSGLNERVQTNLKALDMLLEKLDITSCNPDNDLLSPRVAIPSIMEAYATAKIGHQYAIYFPQGRYQIDFDPWVYADRVKVQWLDVNDLNWSEPEIAEVQWEGKKNNWGFRGLVTIQTPSNRQYIALVEIVE